MCNIDIFGQSITGYFKLIKTKYLLLINICLGYHFEVKYVMGLSNSYNYNTHNKKTPTTWN